MNTKTKLVLSTVGGIALGLGLTFGVMKWTSQSEAGQVVGSAPVVPVPSPRTTPELTNTEPSAVPTQAPVPTPAPSHDPVLSNEGSIRVRRLVVATGVEGHEPTGESDVFELGAHQRIYAFLEVANDDDAARLRVTFEPEEGESTGHVALEVPAHVGRYRTWAFTRNISSSGRWEVVVRDASGHVIARRPFDVE